MIKRKAGVNVKISEVFRKRALFGVAIFCITAIATVGALSIGGNEEDDTPNNLVDLNKTDEPGNTQVADGDDKTGDSLHHIGGDDDHTGFKSAAVILVGGLVHGADTHGDKAQSDAMVGQKLHKAVINCNDAKILQYHQYETGHNSHGHHALADELNTVSQPVADQNCSCNVAQLNNAVPQLHISGRIIHISSSISLTPPACRADNGTMQPDIFSDNSYRRSGSHNTYPPR